MRIGIPKESNPEQPMVAADPSAVKQMIKLGYEVIIERGAGAEASFDDVEYEDAGAMLGNGEAVWLSDIVICLDMPPAADVRLMREGAILVSRLDPSSHPERAGLFEEQGITALAMDMIPRISRAQSMDVRSSMQNIAGYRAVIDAASEFGSFFSGQVTAAGKLPPASVYVIGVGVAGLSAIGTAASLGAQVSATDVRPEVADQVASLGAAFVDIPVKQESEDGYAKAMNDSEAALANAVYAREAAKNDIVITTAQIPGRPSPLLLDREAVMGMQPGSVIIDLGASPQGSNCELTVYGETIKTENDVTIVGHSLSALAAKLPAQASKLYGRNIVNFLKLVTPEKDKGVVLDEDDVIVRGITVTLDGKLMWPPPPVKVFTGEGKGDGAKVVEEKAALPAEESLPGVNATDASDGGKASAGSILKGLWWKVLLVIGAIALMLAAPASMQPHFIVFALAIVAGFYVITGVSHSLHTPLMSVTNAISGIIIIGAMLQVLSADPIVGSLSEVAIAIAAINIFGGFLVTKRMLKMFQRSSE